MPQLLKPLIVEDNPNDADLLILELKRAGFQLESERVDTPETYINALDRLRWDIIFSDHSMPHFSSFEALDIRNRKGLDIPFIILSGTMGEEMAVEAMKAGASDYFVKGKLTRLVAAVNRELQEAKEREARRKTELELQHFVACLTHDLRTPILAELRVLELMEAGTLGSLNPRQLDMLQELIKANRFVQHIVNNILFAYQYKQHRIMLQKEQADLPQFIDSFISGIAIQSLLKEKSHHLVAQHAEAIPSISIDKNEIQRVFLNLIKNAADYTPNAGTITILTEHRDGFVRVGVLDAGPGVDAAVEPCLFMPYAVSSVKKFHHVGAGLGLYLSKQIIEAHNGKIGYEKKPEGSLFYFELPLEPSEEADHSSEEIPYTLSLNGNPAD